MAYTVGDLVRVFGVFTVNSAYADPTTIQIKFKTPAGLTTTWTYGTDNQVVKDSVGVYRADVNVNSAGEWNVSVHGTGAAQGAAAAKFIVDATGT